MHAATLVIFPLIYRSGYKFASTVSSVIKLYNENNETIKSVVTICNM